MNEFVCRYHNGKYDWIDPVLDFEETETLLIIRNGHGTYTLAKEEIFDWTVRLHTEETTYDPPSDKIHVLKKDSYNNNTERTNT
tara:strand:- start:20782 stop:21033 length:252 start_codon:yes stop_codon:yes gene_type:complete